MHMSVSYGSPVGPTQDGVNLLIVSAASISLLAFALQVAFIAQEGRIV